MTVLGAPYDTYKGHTLDSTDAPPGYEDGVSIGLTSAPYDPAGGLECTSCHTQHGQAGVYRNLGPRSLGTGKLPNYVISNTTNDNNKDVWITIASPYPANTGVAATFNPFYATGNVFYNRRDRAVGAVNTSNGVDTQCAACHGEFHGNPGDAGVGGDLPAGAPLEGFIRHPTGGITIGAASAASYGGHSALSRYTGATTKVKVYTTDYTGFANATPGCITCHKAHGNQNPFGLVFLNRNASAVDEQGGYGTAVGTRAVDEPANGYQVGYRNLCGQCHSQGNS